MTKNKLRSRLGFETLERRDVPTFFPPIDFGNLGDLVFTQFGHDVGSITLTNGVIKVEGTDANDIITVKNYEPVISQAFRFPGDDVTIFNTVQVTVADSAGNIRNDVNGNPLNLFFAKSSFSLVEINAWDGNDQTKNLTEKTVVHSGGNGNDFMQGGSGMDILNGGYGFDTLFGGGGNDQLYGMQDADVMRGDNGNDIMQGGDGNDTMDGGSGNDSMIGEAGRDFMNGGFGNDTMRGGDDVDVLDGDGDDDNLYGENGNDLVYGDNGNDNVYGGAGNDYLEGDDGFDGIFGGSGKDTVWGGNGIDRFLKWDATGNSTTIGDKKSNESITTFKNTTSVQTFGFTGGVTLRYQPASFALEEIEQIDAGMAFMHLESANTRLLRRSNGGNMTMLRFGDYIPYDATDGKNDAKDQIANDNGPRFAGFNKGDGRIYFNDDTFDDGADDVARVAVHELAHNWDNENGKFNEWKAISGWVQSTSPNANQTLSADGQWVYNTSAEFARNYGKTNPLEDFTTSFEAYYQLKMGDLSYSDLVRLTPKLNFIGLFITSISG